MRKRFTQYRRRGCDLIRRVYGDFTCCVSCHDDWADGYDYPLEHEWPDGTISEICCAATLVIPRRG